MQIGLLLTARLQEKQEVKVRLIKKLISTIIHWHYNPKSTTFLSVEKL